MFLVNIQKNSGKWKAGINISIYSFIVIAFLMMQLHVEWIKYNQRKSETSNSSNSNNKNDLVLQKSGD